MSIIYLVQKAVNIEDISVTLVQHGHHSYTDICLWNIDPLE